MTRILGAAILILVGVLMAWKYQNFRSSHPALAPSQEEASSLLRKLDVESIRTQISSNEKKITLINYWASWCLPCVKELPSLKALQEKYSSKGLQVILISTDDEKSKQALLSLLAKNDISFETYYRGSQSLEVLDQLYPQWNGALPSNLLVTSKGQPLEAWFGETSLIQFEERIKKHLF